MPTGPAPVDISVADIAAYAGVSYSTFFRHFSDKQELWSVISASLIEGINRRILPLIASENHRGVAQEICEFVAENRALYRVLLTQGAVDHTREAMLSNARHLASLQKAGWTSGFPLGLATEFAVHGIIAMLAWWLRDGAGVKPDEVAAAMDHLIFGPLFEGTFATSRGGGLPSLTDPRSPT
jgi:AcrR family transcriptional regulator